MFDTTTELLAEQIVERGAVVRLNSVSREESMEIIKKAKERYNLDMEAFLNGDEFSFLHDFILIHKHYHKDTDSFDNRFVPRFARPKKKEED